MPSRGPNFGQFNTASSCEGATILLRVNMSDRNASRSSEHLKNEHVSMATKVLCSLAFLSTEAG